MSATTAALLLEELDELGMVIEAHEANLRVRPAKLLTDELALRLRQHKLEVLALLKSPRLSGTCLPGSLDEPPKPWEEAAWHPPMWRCYCCGSRRRWRLAEGSEWVCERCHYPEPHYAIVWDGEEARRTQEVEGA